MGFTLKFKPIINPHNPPSSCLNTSTNCLSTALFSLPNSHTTGSTLSIPDKTFLNTRHKPSKYSQTKSKSYLLLLCLYLITVVVRLALQLLRYLIDFDSIKEKKDVVFVKRSPNFESLKPTALHLMAYSDVLSLILAVGVWCAAYITVAILSSLRIFNSLCPC